MPERQEVREVTMKKTVSIEGMTCAHCTARVTRALQGVTGIGNVTVSLEKNNAVVEGNDFADADIRAAVEDAGYQVTQVK
jgi:copper chaperone CopZ